MSLPTNIISFEGRTLLLDEVELMWNIDRVAEELLLKIYESLGFEYDADTEEPMHLKSKEWNKAINALTEVYQREIEKHAPIKCTLGWKEQFK